MARCAVRGTKFNILQLPQQGKGPQRDLVLCHGLASSMGFWPVDLLGALRRWFRLTLFDQRGHGRTGLTRSGYGAAALGADLAELIDEMGLEKPNIMAHSFGGVAALAMFADQPGKASSLILLDSQIGLGRITAARAGEGIQRSLIEALAAIDVQVDPGNPFLGVHMITALARRQATEPIMDSADRHVAFLLRSMPPARAARWLNMVENTDAIEELTAADGLKTALLGGVTCPVLGIYGRNSPAMHSARLLRDHLPDFTLDVLNDAGHFFVTLKGDQVVERCRKFWGLDVPVSC